MKFEEITLSPDIMSGLEDVNYTELTELQEKVLPRVIGGRDALVKAESGSSKIGSFIIPALELIANKESTEGISVLVLTPNPEESNEIDELVWAMGYHAQIECASVDLDSEPEEQKQALNSEVSVIVGNPGPLADTAQKVRRVFRHVDLVVIDAADEMVSLDLQPKIKAVLRRVLSDHQTLIYMEDNYDEVQDLAKYYLNEPAIIGFDTTNADVPLDREPPEVDGSLTHGYIYVPNRMKITTLMAHIKSTPTDNCVIFTASKRGTDRLYQTLRKQNMKATSLHGKLSDEKREQRFKNFTDGDVQYLLVADIPAAELELDGIVQIINYDVPNDPDEYRYRADLVGTGDTTRLVSLVSKQDRSDINKLESTLAQAPKELPLPDKVQQKLSERKKQESTKKKSKSAKKKRSNGRNKSKKQKKSNELELPRPSYDKLSGGRKGSKTADDDKSGVMGLIKKLFS